MLKSLTLATVAFVAVEANPGYIGCDLKVCLPSMPSTYLRSPPSLPSLASLSSLPSLFSLPSLPSMPSLPSLPSASLPLYYCLLSF